MYCSDDFFFNILILMFSLFHIFLVIIVALLLYSSDHMLLISLLAGKFCMLKFFKFSFAKILSGINSLGPGPEVIKLFSCSTQLSTKFQLLIKTKILTNKEVSCFKSVRCCIYHAHKC